MAILLAVNEPNFLGILRGHFARADLDVIDNDVFHRNYLLEIVDLEKPSILIIHDTYLPSDENSPEGKDREMLQLMEYFRSTYDNSMRIVYLCERDRKDPFLSALVARNVLDIFNERKIGTDAFIEQLKNEPKYSNVSKFGIGVLDVEFDEEPEATEEVYEEERTTEENETEQDSTPSAKAAEKAKQLFENVSERTKSAIDAGNEWNHQRKQEKKVRTPSPESSKTPKKRTEKEIPYQDYLDIMPKPKEVYERAPVIGTVVIGVAGARQHLGSTHTAMSIAAFLRQKKYSVALIELNNSEDFERIHALYEGEKHYLKYETKFDYKGIDHYKFREDMRLGEIMATYEYVVLDIGSYEETPHYQEFLRSHVRLLLVSPYEWKQHWTDQFYKDTAEADTFIYGLPFAGKANVKDMEERFPNLHLVSIPSSPNPYEVSDEAEDSIRFMLQGYLRETTQLFSKKVVIAVSVASAIVTTGIISAFALL